MVRIAAAALLAFAASALAGNGGQAAKNSVKLAQGGGRGSSASSSVGGSGDSGSAVDDDDSGFAADDDDDDDDDDDSGADIGSGGASKTPAVDTRIKELKALQIKKEKEAVKAESEGNPGLANALRTQKNGAIATQLSNLKKAQKAAN